MRAPPAVLRAFLAAIVVAAAGATAVTWLDQAIEPELERLEADDTRAATHRVLTALADEVEDLGDTARDYASWDETWEYLRTRDPGYPERALPSASGTPVRVHGVLLLDEAGNPVHGRWLDLDRHRDEPLPESIVRRLAAPAVRATRTGRRKGGLLQGERGMMLVAARPVLPNSGDGQPRGTLVMARLVDAWQLEKLTRQSRYTLDVSPLPESGQRPPPAAGVVEVTQDAHVSIGSVVIEDLFERPAFRLQVEERRRLPALWAQARTRVGVALAAIALLAAALAARLGSSQRSAP
ncbi:MAG: hypothetical protein NDJ94_08265 [Vicinamibacteria bacterium]|jgi:sensor domain CHASE-containing protein|nr:hypothetical protein [Vicinamibacteria bacterium]